MADIDVRITTNATQAAGSFDQLRDSMRAAGTAQTQMTNGLGAATSQLSAAQSAALAAAGSAYRLAASMAPVGSAAASAAQAITRLGSEARSLSALSAVAGQARTLATAMREQATAAGAASSSIRSYIGPAAAAGVAMSQMAAQARALTAAAQAQGTAIQGPVSSIRTYTQAMVMANSAAKSLGSTSATTAQGVASFGAVASRSFGQVSTAISTTTGLTGALAARLQAIAARSGNASSALGRLASATRSSASATQAQATASNAAAAALQKEAQAAEKAGQATTASALAATYGARQVINMAHGFVELSDTGTNAINRLRNVTGSAEEAESTFRKLVDVSKRTYTEVEGNTMLFQRMSTALKETGRSGDQVIRIIETLGKAVSTSGASAVEAKNALIQLSQAFNRGVLRGDELRSISEQLPVVLDIVAAKMGVTSTKLKVMALENGIATTLVADAVEAAADRIDADFSKISPTIEGSMTTLKAALTEAVFDFNKFTGASTIITGAILLVANNMGIFITVAAGLTLTVAINSLSRLAVVASLLNVRMAAVTLGMGLMRVGGLLATITFTNIGLAAIRATTAVWAFNAAVLANPLTWIAVGVAVAVAAIIYFRSTIAKAMQTMADWFGFGPQMAAFLSVMRGAFNFLAATIQTLMIALGLVAPPIENVTTAVDDQAGAVSGLSGELDGLATAYGDTGKSVLDFKDNLVDPAAINEAKKVVAGYGTAMQGLAAKQNDVSIATRTLAETQLKFGAAAAAGNLQAQTAIINAHTELAIATGKVNEHKEAMTTLSEAETAQNSVLVETVGQSQRFASVTAESTAAVGEQAKAIQTTKDEAVSSFSAIADSASSMASSIESNLSSAISSVISYIGSLISRVRDAISALAELAGAKSSAGSTDTVAAPDSVAPTDSASTAATSQLSAYAVGGQFMVGGSGGVDSRLVQFWASPDERVVIETPMQQKISDQYRARLPKFANGGMIGGISDLAKKFDTTGRISDVGSGDSTESEAMTFADADTHDYYPEVIRGADGKAVVRVTHVDGVYGIYGAFPNFLTPDTVTDYPSVSAASSALSGALQQDGIIRVHGVGYATNGGAAKFYTARTYDELSAEDTVVSSGEVTEKVRALIARAENYGAGPVEIDGRFPTKEEDPSADNFHPTRDDNGKPIPGSGNMDDYSRSSHKRIRWPKGKDPESLAIKEKIGSADDIYARAAKENYLVDQAVAGPSKKGSMGDSGDDFERSGKYVTKGGKTYLKGHEGKGGIGASGGGQGGIDKNGAMTHVTMNISTPNATTFLRNSNAIRQKQRLQLANR